MAFHEPRMSRGGDTDPSASPIQLVYVDDQGVAHYPGDVGYVEPEAGPAEFLRDQAQSLIQQYNQITQQEDAEAAGQAPAPSEEDLQTREAVRQAVENLSSQEPPHSVNAPDVQQVAPPSEGVSPGVDGTNVPGQVGTEGGVPVQGGVESAPVQQPQPQPAPNPPAQ